MNTRPPPAPRRTHRPKRRPARSPLSSDAWLAIDAAAVIAVTVLFMVVLAVVA